jgi:hypothetical protein
MTPTHEEQKAALTWVIEVQIIIRLCRPRSTNREEEKQVTRKRR